MKTPKGTVYSERAYTGRIFGSYIPDDLTYDPNERHTLLQKSQMGEVLMILSGTGTEKDPWEGENLITGKMVRCVFSISNPFHAAKYLACVLGEEIREMQRRIPEWLNFEFTPFRRES